MTEQDTDDRAGILADINRYQDRWISHQTKRALSADPRERALLQRLMDEDRERIARLRKKLARGGGEKRRDGDTG